MGERPTTLSDPYMDWDGCEHILARVINTPVDELTTDDYHVIFARNLPAADYEEGVYYLEPCLDFIARSWLKHESAYPDSVLWWIDHFKDHLATDGLLDATMERVRTTVFTLLDRFELFSMTKEECRSAGRDFNYSVGPYNQSTVWDLIDDLTIWPLYDETVDEIVSHLSDLNVATRARWWVEIASHSRIWCLFYQADCAVDDYGRKERLFHRLHDFRVLNPAAEIATTAAFEEGHTKYNKIVGLT